MKTLRFKVGDLARVVKSTEPKNFGLVVRIERLASHRLHPIGGISIDYWVVVDGIEYCAPDEWLAPLPGESDFHIHADTLKLFDQKPNTDLPIGPKVKERV